MTTGETALLFETANRFAVSPWFESAADLLAEPDPGPTPFLIDDLIVENAIATIVGPPKVWKTWTLIDFAIAVSSGEKALGAFSVPNPGPALVILEESGRRAFHRRLDSLVRGRALAPERVQDLYYACNRRVRLDTEEWRTRLLEAATAKPWRLIALDPFSRLHGVDENAQKEISPLLHFLRELREESRATVAYVHHSGHSAGGRQRGSSDLEAFWESKLVLTSVNDKRTLEAEHREAERAGPFDVSFHFDSLTRSLRLTASDDSLARKVREYLDEHPLDSANKVHEAIGGNRQTVLELVKTIREGGSE